MAELTIPDLGTDLTERLQRRAHAHGRSPEAEARAILDAALLHDAGKSGETLADLAQRTFGPDHGFDLDPYLPAREAIPEPALDQPHDHS